jgi:hypothetical protein
VKFSSSGARLWGTYYGGVQYEGPWQQLSTDAAGNLFFSGETYSSTGIGTSTGFQNFLTGTRNGFLVMFDTAGSRICGTYYGQTTDYNAHAFPDGRGHIYLSGSTKSSSGIASGGFQNTYGGNTDAFLVKFTACFSGMGVEDEHAELFSVWPTRSEGIFFLKSSDVDCIVSVFSGWGEKLFEARTTGTSFQFDLTSQPNGIYLVTVDSPKGRSAKKVIIQK